MKNYKKVDYTLDEKIVGYEGYQFTVEITSRSFKKFNQTYNSNIKSNLKNFSKNTDYSLLPDNLKGKLYKKNSFIDFMDFTPNSFGLKFVVTNKVKFLIENYKNFKNDCFFKEISLKKFEEPFYLMCIPFVKNEFINFERTIFYKATYEGLLEKTYKNKEDYYADITSFYSPGECYLNYDFSELNIINLQSGGLYFSEELIKHLMNNNVIGLDVSGKIKIIMDF